MKTLRIMGLLFALITLSIAPTTSNAQTYKGSIEPLIFTQHMVFNLTHTFMWVQVLEYV